MPQKRQHFKRAQLRRRNLTQNHLQSSNKMDITLPTSRIQVSNSIFFITAVKNYSRID